MPRQILKREHQLEGATVVGDVGDVAGIWDSDDQGGAEHPGKGDLKRRRAMAFGDRCEGGGVGELTLADRAVGHCRDAALRKLRQQVELRTALGDIVEDLIGHAGLAAGAEQLVHIAVVEVADAPAPDLAGADRRFHTL